MNESLYSFRASTILYLALDLLVLDVVLGRLLVQQDGAGTIDIELETPYSVVVFQIRVRLDDVDAFVHAASPDVFPDVGAKLGVNRLPPVLRGGHDMVFAIPFGVRQTRHFVVLKWHNIKVLLGYKGN